MAGSLEDPLQTWPNSDLLIDAEDQAFFARHYPDFAPVFDWAELRSLFVRYDAAASRARAHSRRSGIFAVIFGFLGLTVGASVPLIDGLTNNGGLSHSHAPDVLGAVAGLLAIFSIAVGYTQVLKGKDKARWLTNRFWTERIRQFHFQLIVNHLPVLIAAIKSKNELRDWLEFRARELDRFEHDYLRGVEDKIRHLEQDEAEDSPWISQEWDHAGPVPPPSEEFDELLALLDQQRFGVQQRYAERKLLIGWHSPETGSQWILKLSDFLTAVLLLATITVGLVSIIAFVSHADPKIRLIAAFVAALASSSVVAMRALKEGLLFNADAERYKWYLAAVRTLYRRYEHADLPRKIFLLRELERTAYQEMRRFMLSAAHARFVM
ncbi:MAG: hypothetical protein ACLPV8_02445 [Steroidobacteraceae bacterium]